MFGTDPSLKTTGISTKVNITVDLNNLFENLMSSVQIMKGSKNKFISDRQI